MNNLVTSKNDIQQDGLDHALKVTSLLYLKEALSDEAYEQCAEIVRGAKECGVSPDEIKKLLEEHIANLKVRDRKAAYTLRKP